MGFNTVMVIGCCAMVYIIIQENRRRKSAYYLMRCIGASKGQIRAFSIQESVFTMLPAAQGGCAWGVPDMCRGCGFREQGGGYRVFFRLCGRIAAADCGSGIFTMLVAVLASRPRL